MVSNVDIEVLVLNYNSQLARKKLTGDVSGIEKVLVEYDFVSAKVLNSFLRRKGYRM